MNQLDHHHHFWERHGHTHESEKPRISPTLVTGIAFVTYVILGASAPVAIRATYAELDPFWSGALRFGCGAAVFWALMAWKKIPLPRGQALVGALVYGALMFGGMFLFAYYGLKGVPAGMFQTLIAVVPLMTFVLAVVQGHEEFHWQGLAGALLAIAGIAAIFGAAQGSLPAVDRLVAVFLAAFCASEVAVLIKRFPRSHVFATNAIGMTIGALLLAGASFVFGETHEHWLPVSTNGWLWLIYLIVVLAVIVFILFLYVLARWSASAIVYGTVLTPLFGVVLAALIAGEIPSSGLLVGAPLVLLGVFVGTIAPKHKPIGVPAKTPAPALSGAGTTHEQ